MVFLSPRWDMLVPWGVSFLNNNPKTSRKTYESPKKKCETRSINVIIGNHLPGFLHCQQQNNMHSNHGNCDCWVHPARTSVSWKRCSKFCSVTCVKHRDGQLNRIQLNKSSTIMYQNITTKTKLHLRKCFKLHQKSIWHNASIYKYMYMATFIDINIYLQFWRCQIEDGRSVFFGWFFFIDTADGQNTVHPLKWQKLPATSSIRLYSLAYGFESCNTWTSDGLMFPHGSECFLFIEQIMKIMV